MKAAAFSSAQLTILPISYYYSETLPLIYCYSSILPIMRGNIQAIGAESRCKLPHVYLAALTGQGSRNPSFIAHTGGEAIRDLGAKIISITKRVGAGYSGGAWSGGMMVVAVANIENAS
jgi:hypothetical protein